MSQRTVLNDKYRGLVETCHVPAEVHDRDGNKFASCAGVVPIHCCTPEEVSERLERVMKVAERSKTTHHYTDIFTDKTLAPLEELAYVRLDDTYAEKVFINRTKRILLVSADGVLASWRSCPTFESANMFVAGTPIVNKDGRLVSVVTAKRGNHYAVSGFEGDGGYFETPKQWKILDTPEGGSIYGDKSFTSRDKLRDYVSTLPPLAEGVTTPVLHRGANRIALVAQNRRQVVHMYLHGVIISNVDYL